MIDKINSKKIMILAGGGVRGAIQIPYLIELEKTGRKVCDQYDIIVGSSVGAINGAMMATGLVDAKKFSEAYKDTVYKMFKKKPWWKFPKLPLYDRNAFMEMWDNLIGLDFKFGDVKTNLMITSVNRVRDEYGCEQNVIFKSWNPEYKNLRLVDVVMYSFAAPIYFGNMIVPELNMVLGDGGQANLNMNIDYAHIQAIANGWGTKEIPVVLDCIDTGYVVNKKTQDFNEVAKQTQVKQLSDYINPSTGGQCREMSTSDQINKMKYTCKYNPYIKFRYRNIQIDKNGWGMAKLNYLDNYFFLGKLMAIRNPIIQFN